MRNYRFDIQALASHTREPNDTILSADAIGQTIEHGAHTLALDGEQFWGHGVSTHLGRNARLWSWDLNYDENSPTFRADNGFVTKNDFRQAEASTNLDLRPNKKYLLQIVPSIDVGRVWNFDKVRKDELLVPHLDFVTTAQTEIWVEYLWSRELFRDQVFPGIRRLSLGINSRPSEFVGFDLETTSGRFIARGSQLSEPVLGAGRTWFASLSLKTTQRLLVEPSLDYSQLYYPDGGAKIFKAYVIRSRFTYQFTRELFLRLVAEYRDQDNYNGDTPMTYSRDRGFTVEPLLSYKLNAFTIFYIGSSHDYLYDNLSTKYLRTAQRFFVKFQYLFRV